MPKLNALITTIAINSDWKHHRPPSPGGLGNAFSLRRWLANRITNVSFPREKLNTDLVCACSVGLNLRIIYLISTLSTVKRNFRVENLVGLDFTRLCMSFVAEVSAIKSLYSSGSMNIAFVNVSFKYFTMHGEYQCLEASLFLKTPVNEIKPHVKFYASSLTCQATFHNLFRSSLAPVRSSITRCLVL